MALHLAECSFDNVEMGGRLDRDRGQCRRGHLLLFRWRLWILGWRDGLVGYRKVTSWASVSPLSFVFAVLPKE